MSTAPRLAAVLLAAGAARRYGRPKQLERYEGQSLVRGAAEAALAVSETLIVVTGNEAAAVEDTLAGLPLHCLHCADWALGMGHSMAAAFRVLARAPNPHDGALLCLADQPLVRRAALQRLVTTWAGRPTDIVVSDYGAQRGPPAVFPARLFAALSTLEGDAGARGLLRDRRDEAHALAMPEAAFDIDTPDDLARLQQQDAG